MRAGLFWAHGGGYCLKGLGGLQLLMESLESLRNSLYLAAKADARRRFYSLHDKICRIDVLHEAWRRVRANHGTNGVDNQTISDIEEYGVDRFLSQLQEELRHRTYRVQHVKRLFIPKRDGSQRPLGIPTVRDRVVQQAVRLVIEPIFEADFQPFSYGYRPGRSARQASEAIYRWLCFGLTSIVDVDIKGFFDHINHERLLSFVRERIADSHINKLIREWLRAGVVYLNEVTYPEEGTPQGGVISPFLANVFLNKLDSWWSELGMDRKGGRDAHMVRYADDVVILAPSCGDTEYIKQIFEALLEELGLTLNAEKSRIVTAREGFDFLSFHFIRRFRKRKGKEVALFFPSRDAVQRFKERVRVIASIKTCHLKDERQLAWELNLFMRGWSNYFNHSHASEAYNHLQEFVRWKFKQFIRFRHKLSHLAVRYRSFNEPSRYGLMQLTGRISHLG